MQNAFVILLVVVLIVSVVSFAVMGSSQRRRTRRLSRRAHERGMLFSAADPFDAPRRYSSFALMAAGHSPRASNVTYGRLEGLPLRAFDFRHELGHGTHRTTRHYGVIVAETGLPCPPVLMWNDRDAEYAPLAARAADGRIEGWRYVGDPALAGAMGQVCEGLAAEGLSLQTQGGCVLFCIPVRRGRQDYLGRLDRVAAVLRQVRQWQAEGGRRPPQRPQDTR